MTKYIYVILTKTLTIPGIAIRKILKDEYSHASIALDENLNEMYSFSRFHYQNPLVGGFVRENVEILSLRKEKEVDSVIFKIPVTSQQYDNIKEEIEYFKKHGEKYMYNLFALIFFPTRFQFEIRDSYICTGFVAYLLRKNGIENEKLVNKKVVPMKLLETLKAYEYYNGSLQDYVRKVDHQEFENDYFKRENIFLVIGKSLKQIGRLIYRKIT